MRHRARPGPEATRARSRPPAVLLLLLVLVAMIGGALPANAADDEREALAPRRLFDQSRPGVELITASFRAKMTVPEPVVTAADQQALRARVIDKIRRGEIPATQTAATGAVIDEIARDPFRWLTPSNRVHQEAVKLSASGSGFSISADGYIVTNAHVAAPRAQDLKAAIIAHGLQDQRDDFIREISQGGLSQSRAAKYFGAIVRWATKTAKLSKVKKRLAAVSSSGTGGVTYAKGRPARLVAAGRELPGKDVAIIKVKASNMATVQLGDDTALSTGDRLFVLGFPAAATFNPVLSKASHKEPTLTQGVLSAKKTVKRGSTVLQTDATMTHGNSGGPVFDEQGRVVGVATFGSVDPMTGREVAGLNFAVPVSAVRELLTRAKIEPDEGTATEKYRLGLDAFDKQWYKRALPLFKRVKALDPAHPSVERFITDSEAAIRQGRDRTPREILGLPLVLFIALVAIVGLLVVGILVRTLVRRRRVPPRLAMSAMSAVRREPVPQVYPATSQPPALGERAPVEASDWWTQPLAPVAPVGRRTAPDGFPPNDDASWGAARQAAPASESWWPQERQAAPASESWWPQEEQTAQFPAPGSGDVPEHPQDHKAPEPLICSYCGHQSPPTVYRCEWCQSTLRS